MNIRYSTQYKRISDTQYKRISDTLLKFSEMSKDTEMNSTIFSCRIVHRSGKIIIGTVLYLS